MISVDRHGGASHYMRPDRVYRTGVLSPMQGYQPNQDVQAVAAEFTDFPTDLQTAGLGMPAWLMPGPTGLFQRLKLKWQLWRARKMMPMLPAPSQAPLSGVNGLGAIEPGMARDMTGKLEMLATMMSSGLPPDVRGQQMAMTMGRWNNSRWPR